MYDGIDYLNSNTQFYDNIWQVVFPILLFLLAVSLIAILFWVLKYLRNKHYFVKHTEDESKSKETSEKMSLLDFWKYSVANEKVYMVACVGFSVLMWIINTLNGFTG